MVAPFPPQLARHQPPPAVPMDTGPRHGALYRCLQLKLRRLLGREVVKSPLVPGADNNFNQLERIVRYSSGVLYHSPRKRVLFHCDNAAVVAIWWKGSCKCPNLMSLVRHLFLMAARGNYHVGITHIAGVQNSIADNLSRFSMQAFHTAAPVAATHPTTPSIPVLQTDI